MGESRESEGIERIVVEIPEPLDKPVNSIRDAIVWVVFTVPQASSEACFQTPPRGEVPMPGLTSGLGVRESAHTRHFFLSYHEAPGSTIPLPTSASLLSPAQKPPVGVGPNSILRQEGQAQKREVKCALWVMLWTPDSS